MNHATNRGDIDRAVKLLPALSAEATNPAGGGRDGQRNEKNKPCEADGDEAALDDVGPHVVKIELLVDHEPREEVQANVEESEETEHAAEANELGKVKEFAKGRDAKGEDEEADGPVPGEVSDELDGIGSEIGMKSAPSKRDEGRDAKKKDDDLGPFAGKESVHEAVPG